MHPRHLRRLACAALVVLAGSCGGDEQLDINLPSKPASPASEGRLEESTGAEHSAPDLLLTSSFDGAICGFWHQPLAGCEFGAQGQVDTGSFDPRTGSKELRVQRLSSEHMGVLVDLPLPGGTAFVGVAHRVPELSYDLFPPGVDFIQLEQLSPTDGTIPAWPIEVRLHTDRRLGLALYQDGPAHDGDEALTGWRAPLDEWFYLVVEAANGNSSTQRMWVYDAQDTLVEEVSVELDTAVEWVHEGRTAQKIGGTVSTLQPAYTFHDDFYVATRDLGPLRIATNGDPQP